MSVDSSQPTPILEDPDVVLMLEVAKGSEEAFAALVGRHQNPLLNFFARMGALSHGEDLVQETFVRLFRYRQKYRATAPFGAFLYRIARNVWADHGRKIVRMDRLATDYEQELSVPPPVKPMGRELDIQGALEQLSPKLREVLVLNVYQGLRYQEIADALEIPLGTVKSRINLALGALREILNET